MAMASLVPKGGRELTTREVQNPDSNLQTLLNPNISTTSFSPFPFSSDTHLVRLTPRLSEISRDVACMQIEAGLGLRPILQSSISHSSLFTIRTLTSGERLEHSVPVFGCLTLNGFKALHRTRQKAIQPSCFIYTAAERWLSYWCINRC